jgi:hypothetical protein
MGDQQGFYHAALDNFRDRAIRFQQRRKEWREVRQLTCLTIPAR